MNSSSSIPAASEAFEVNEPMVISETIAKETVIINLHSGNYYSLKHSGAVIWSAIEKGATFGAIVDTICSVYDVNADVAALETAKLVNGLIEEGLIRPAASKRATFDIVAGETVEAFVSPVLDKFTDMEAMLLLDPIHDVDDEGWPHLPPTG